MDSFLKLLSTDMIIFVVALASCAFFAFLETTITKMRLFNIKELKNSTKKYMSILTSLEENPQEVLIAILIVTNMASITAAVIAEHLIQKVFATLSLPEGLGFSIGIAFATIITSVFGEILPKSMAQSQGTPVFISTLWIINLIYYVFKPITQPLNYFIQRLSKNQSSTDIITEKEVRFLIDYIEQKGHIDTEKTNMLQNIFRMTNTYVKEILIPKNEMVSIDIDTKIAEVLDIFEEHHFSRLPVYKKDQENIIGIIYQKDLFLKMQTDKDVQIKDIVRPIIFVPDSLKVNELLKTLNKRKFTWVSLLMNMEVLLD